MYYCQIIEIILDDRFTKTYFVRHVVCVVLILSRVIRFRTAADVIRIRVTALQSEDVQAPSQRVDTFVTLSDSSANGRSL